MKGQGLFTNYRIAPLKPNVNEETVKYMPTSQSDRQKDKYCEPPYRKERLHFRFVSLIYKTSKFVVDRINVQLKQTKQVA